MLSGCEMTNSGLEIGFLFFAKGHFFLILTQRNLVSAGICGVWERFSNRFSQIGENWLI